jgi:hypothetical protein
MVKQCPICLDVHEAHQAHRFVDNKVANGVANKKSKYRDPEARKKYMRELMRKRRAKAV